jgi:hypothetical protein
VIGVFGGRLSVATACLTLVAGMLTVEGSSAPAQARWRPLVGVPGIVDVVGPRPDGRLVLATQSGLFLYRPGRPAQEFARGTGGYTAAGGEPYIALGHGLRVPSANCSFRRDEIFALDADAQPGLVRVDRNGQARRLLDFPAGSLPSGLAFDVVGRFGYRLLVTVVITDATTLYAIDCRGRSTVVMQGGARVEGGMAVAPRSFGRFGGDLIAPDERTGRIFAFGPGGRVRLVVVSGLPAGGDIGVEGVGFVPTRLGSRGAAYFSDLGAPGAPTEGTDSLLVLQGADLSRAQLRAGELVAATEAGARTIAVRCARRCTVRRVAEGPAAAHGEGHVTFVPGT